MSHHPPKILRFRIYHDRPIVYVRLLPFNGGVPKIRCSLLLEDDGTSSVRSSEVDLPLHVYNGLPTATYTLQGILEKTAEPAE